MKVNAIPKCLVSAFTAIAMTAMLLPVPYLPQAGSQNIPSAMHAAAADTAAEETWELDKNGVLTISGTGTLTDNQWASETDLISKVKSVVISEGITGIGRDYFHGIHFNELESFKLPESLQIISQYAFNNCFGITHLDIPKNVLLLEKNSLDYCNDLKSITIYNPNCVIETTFPGANIIPYSFRSPFEDSNFEISGYAGSTADQYARQYYCVFTDLETKEVTRYHYVPDIPGTEGQGWSFDRETGTLTLLPGVENERVNTEWFSEVPWYDWMPDIKKVIIADGVKAIPASAFAGMRDVADIVIPDSVETIGNDAFHNSSVTALTLPESVKSVGKSAFDNALNLAYVKFLNPYCEINLDQGYPYIRFVYGYDASTAEEAAEKWGEYYGCKFVSLGEIPDHLRRPEQTEPYTTAPPVQTTRKTTPTTAASKPTPQKTTPTTAASKPTTQKTTPTSTTTTTTTTTAVKAKEKFIWGKDNWSFNNDDKGFGDYNAKHYPDSFYVTETVKSQMMHDLKMDYKDAEEFQRAAKRQENASVVETPNKRAWPGSCFGMTLSQLMVKQGVLDLSRYGGKTVVNENTNTDTMLSVINMFQIHQNNSMMLQALRQNAIMDESGVYTQEDYLKALISAVKNEPYPVKLTYAIQSRDTSTNEITYLYHAVLAYGIEEADYDSTLTRKHYTHRILIADPNYLSQNAVYDDACLYYTLEDGVYSWIVPSWCKTYPSAQFRCFSSPANEQGKIDSIMRYTETGAGVDAVRNEAPPQYMAGMEVTTFGNAEPNATIIQNKKEDKTQYANNNNGNGNNVARYHLSGASEPEESEKSYFAFWNPLADYELNYKQLSACELKMDYEDVVYFADLQNINRVRFKPGGEIDLEGSNSNYDLTMVTNQKFCVTDWYRVSVQGKKASGVSYYKDPAGYILEGDNLKNVTVTAHNDHVDVSTTFSAKGSSVLIYEVNETTIGIKEDTDGDGTYETVIETVQMLRGDADSSGSVDILDVIRVNKSVLGVIQLTDTQKQTADVNQNGSVDSTDSLALLKLILGIAG